MVNLTTILLGACVPWGLLMVGLFMAGLFFTNYPPSWEKNPLLRTRGYVILRGSRGGSVGSAFDCEPMCCRFESSQGWTFRSPPPVLCNWVIKCLGMSSHVCVWLGNQRSWYVQPCLCDWACKRSRATYRKRREGDCLPVVGFLLVSFIK